jgi:hypothetical protein
MVLIGDKQVVFSATFLANHADTVTINATTGLTPITFRLEFGANSPNEFLSISPNPAGFVALKMTPAHAVVASEPVVLGSRVDGAPLYLAYTENTYSNKSLVTLFVFAGPVPGTAPAP